jgi:hypothetical protein
MEKDFNLNPPIKFFLSPFEKPSEMKKRTITVFGVTLIAAVFTVGGVDFSSNFSLDELRSKAEVPCPKAENTDCVVSETGNIYAGYRNACSECELIEN